MVRDRLPRSSLTKVLHLVDFLPALCVGGSIRRMRRKRTHRELPLWGSCHGSAVTERVDDLLAENRTPPIALRGPFGAASACQKSLAEFRARKREIKPNHFLRRHVRRRKYFSAHKCANRPPQADGAFAQGAASTLSENPAGVFRQSPPQDRIGSWGGLRSFIMDRSGRHRPNRSLCVPVRVRVSTRISSSIR